MENIHTGSGRAGTSSGRTRVLESGTLTACGLAASSEERPLPSDPGPAAVARVRGRARATASPAPPASFPAGSHRSPPRAGAIGAFPETYAKRHGKPSTK